MSVLEIILYSCLGVSVVVYTTIMIYKYKHPEKFKRKNRKNDDDEEE